MARANYVEMKGRRLREGARGERGHFASGAQLLDGLGPAPRTHDGKQRHVFELVAVLR